MILRLCHRLRFGKRQENGCVVEPVRIGSVDALHDKGLILHSAIGGVKRELNVIASFSQKMPKTKFCPIWSEICQFLPWSDTRMEM